MFNHKADYRLQGTRREYKAIGEFQTFEVFVSHDVDVITPKQAMDSARTSMYNDGYDHINFINVAIRKNKRWVQIPMMEALELE